MVNKTLADRGSQNIMSDEATMTQASTRDASKKQSAVKKQGTTTPKEKDSKNTDRKHGKENINNNESNVTSSQDEKCVTPNIIVDTGDGKYTTTNGHPPISEAERRRNFIKQESEASSSGATADFNHMMDSTITNTTSDSMAGKSMATSVSIGGQTDKSAGAESANSTQSNQSSSEILAKGIETVCKFYAKQPGDHRRCLLRDVAISNCGDILITDSRNKNIKLFTMDGEFIKSIQHTELRDPFGIAMMAGSKFVVADRKAKDLKIFSMDGSLVQSVGHNLDDLRMQEPRGVAVNSKGEIIVSDASRRCVYIYPLEGAFCDVIWGEAGLKPLQFKNPAYVGVTDCDDIIVSDYYGKKVAVFDAHTHDLKYTYGSKKGDKKLRYPRGVATDSKGNILVADNYTGKVHYVNGEEGTFVKFIYGDKHGIHRPRSVAVDNDGNFVVIENGGRVRVFNMASMERTPPPSDE